MVQEYGLFIGGKWRKSDGKRFETHNPATGETLATFPLATKDELNQAVRQAKEGFDKWKKTPAPRRGELLLEAARIFRRKKEDLARTVTTEMGKIIAEGRGDVQEVIDFYEYAAGEGRRMFGETVPSELPNKMCLTTRLPVGPVGLITPWNFPMAIPAWKRGATVHRGIASDCPRESLRSSGRRTCRAGGEAPGRKSHRREDGHGSRRIRRPGEEGLGVHRDRQEGGGQAPHGRTEVEGRSVRPRILHLPDGLRGRPQEAPGPRRDLRTCTEPAQGERLRRRGRDRELREVWTQFVDLHERPSVGVPRDARARGRNHIRERADDRGRGPATVRRYEGDGSDRYSGSRDDGARGVHVLEDGLRRLLGSPATGAD